MKIGEFLLRPELTEPFSQTAVTSKIKWRLIRNFANRIIDRVLKKIIVQC